MLWESDPAMVKVVCALGAGCERLHASCPPAAAASLRVGKLALRSLNGSRPGLKVCRLDYTRHLIFQLEKCFSLALLMKIN